MSSLGSNVMVLFIFTIEINDLIYTKLIKRNEK